MMNKKKLVELAEEVLTDIDEGLEQELRKNLEKELCGRLSTIFSHAKYHLNSFSYGNENNKDFKKSYDSVKPIIDEAIDKLLDKGRQWATYITKNN